MTALRQLFLSAFLNVALFSIGAAIMGSPVALAGHTFGGGDCWRAGTPTDCRTAFYSGPGHTIHVRIVNQLNDGTLWNNTVTACNNWNVAPGPQFCQSTPATNDSFIYFKRDDNQGAPNGYTWNCISGHCPASLPTNAEWSEIYLTNGDDQFGSLIISISGHEIGHALGLDHHGPIGSNQALMTQGTTLQSPNNNDIGPLPACATSPVGSNGSGGVRCIYNAVA